MGLIDADKIINRLDAVTKDGGENVKVFSINDIKYLLNNEPTAYDVDKVVKEINEWTFNANIDVGDGTVMNHNLIVRDTAIEIVKAGGNIELSEHSKSQSNRTGK